MYMCLVLARSQDFCQIIMVSLKDGVFSVQGLYRYFHFYPGQTHQLTDVRTSQAAVKCVNTGISHCLYFYLNNVSDSTR